MKRKTWNIRICWDGRTNKFDCRKCEDNKTFVSIYKGSREECEVILESFVRVGFIDCTSPDVRSDSHTSYCEMNLQSHPDLGRY